MERIHEFGKDPATGQSAPGSSTPVVLPDAVVTTVLYQVTLGADRLGTTIDKSGFYRVAIDVAIAEGAAAFDAVGVLKVLASNAGVLGAVDALDIPQLAVTAAGSFKMELETAFTQLTVFYDRTSDGDDDLLTVRIAVSQ